MLGGEVQILHHLLITGNLLNEGRVEVGRVGIEEPNPSKVINLRKPLEEFVETFPAVEVYTVKGAILGDEVYLFSPA